jgi:hypothetical protein
VAGLDFEYLSMLRQRLEDSRLSKMFRSRIVLARFNTVFSGWDEGIQKAGSNGAVAQDALSSPPSPRPTLAGPGAAAATTADSTAATSAQRAFYCGFIRELVQHAGDRPMSTRQVRRWFAAHPALCPVPDLSGYDIDHFLPRGRGGHDHPYNYFVMPPAANRSFSKDVTAAKAAYVGWSAARCAGRFAREMRDQALPLLQYLRFSPVDGL